jgi:hypothetical protein
MNEPTAPLQMSWLPEVADYTEAFNARNRAHKAWHKIAVVSVFGAVFAIVAFSLGRPGPAMVGVEAAVLLPVIVLPITWLSTRSVWRRRPALHAPTRAVVDPSAGITTDGPLVDMSSGQVAVAPVQGGLPWQSVGRILETRRVFVVELAGHRGKRFILLAKRGLADPAGLAALRGALTAGRPPAG